MATDYLGWSLDFSCVMMLVCLKTIGAAYNVYDGQKDITHVSGFHKEKLVSKVPNPLEYFGFMFYYPTVMSGPVIELKDYLDFVNGVRCCVVFLVLFADDSLNFCCCCKCSEQCTILHYSYYSTFCNGNLLHGLLHAWWFIQSLQFGSHC